jgi:cytoskeleton protein RodZ
MPPPDDHSADARDERAPPGQSVGATLRAARLRLGQELPQVAGVLRIRAPFLQAIEDGQFEALPGVPYAIGFVRTYAEHLGLDGAEMVRQFKSEAAGLERKTNLSFPSPAPEGRVPGTAALLISLVAATLVFGGWYLYQNAGERLTLRVPEVPERLAGPSALTVGGLGETPTEAPATSADASPTPGGPTPAGSSSAAAIPPVPSASPGMPSTAVPGAVAGAPAARPTPPVADAALPPPPGDPTRRLAAAAPPVPAATAPAPPPGSAPAGTVAEPEDSPPPDPTNLSGPPPAAAAGGIPPVPQVAATTPDGRVFGAQNGDSRVVIKAHGESWVQVRDATNTPLLTRVLRPGDSYRVPNQAGLTMMTGNAGVLDVFVDGNAAPALGAVGAVRRNIALDADRLRTGAVGAP